MCKLYNTGQLIQGEEEKRGGEGELKVKIEREKERERETNRKIYNKYILESQIKYI